MSATYLQALPGSFDERFVTLSPDAKRLASAIRAAGSLVGVLADPSMTRASLDRARDKMAQLPGLLASLDELLNQEAGERPDKP